MYRRNCDGVLAAAAFTVIMVASERGPPATITPLMLSFAAVAEAAATLLPDLFCGAPGWTPSVLIES